MFAAALVTAAMTAATMISAAIIAAAMTAAALIAAALWPLGWSTECVIVVKILTYSKFTL